MSKEFFHMSKDEFLFEHDYETIVDLLNRHIELRYGKQELENKVETVSNPRDFF